VDDDENYSNEVVVAGGHPQSKQVVGFYKQRKSH
jgi:hypothetical protein